MISVAKTCQDLSNFGATFGIVCGISPNQINKYVSNAEVLQRWTSLEKLVHHENDFCRYAKSLRDVSIDEPCVPYLGWTIHTVILAQHGSASFVESKLNQERLRVIWSAIKEFMSWKNPSIEYPFVNNCGLQHLLVRKFVALGRDQFGDDLFSMVSQNY